MSESMLDLADQADVASFVKTGLKTNLELLALEPSWLSWKEWVAMFPEYKDDQIGERYQPMLSFYRPPAGPGEHFNSAVIVTCRLANSYQSCAMTSPLVAGSKEVVAVFKDGVDNIIAQLTQYHTLKSYIKS